jgi:hypothetical protein
MVADAPAVQDHAGETFPEPDWFREFVAGLYARLRERVRGSGFLTRDDFEAEVRQARSSVGGTARAHRRRQLASQAEHAPQEAEPAAACEDSGNWLPRLEKTHAAVAYRPAEDEARSCGQCRYFLAGQCSLVEGTIDARMTCDLFAPLPVVTPSPGAEPAMPELYREVVVGEGERGPRLFAEVAFAEPPDRVPVLPKPGVYRHPVYGEIRLTPERIARFVANHNARLYGQDIPILVDAEHVKLYGAMGQLGEARVEPDGSVTAAVTWTRRGEQLIREGRVKYVSPQWYETWSDPVTGETYRDVLVGLALTTRPFFKEDVLRPLVAGETPAGEPCQTVDGQCFPATDWAYVPDPESPSTWKLRLTATPGGDPDPRVVAAAVAALGPGGFRGQRVEIPAEDLPAVIRRVRAAWKRAFPDRDPEEMPDVLRQAAEGSQLVGDGMGTSVMAASGRNKETVTMAEEQIQAIEARIAQQFAEQLAAEREARQAAEARVAALEEIQRRKEFTDEVMGRSDANGTPWAFAGEFAGDYVAIMEALPAELRGKFVEMGRRLARAFAELERQASLTSETGSDARAASGTLAEINRLVGQKVAAGVDPVTAQSQVFRERPDLYKRYRSETAVRV